MIVRRDLGGPANALLEHIQQGVSSHLEIVSEKHDGRRPVLPGGVGAVWSGVSQ
jgi:hypothetical protein